MGVDVAVPVGVGVGVLVAVGVRVGVSVTLAGVAVGIWLPFSPFASALGLQRLPALYWPILAAMIVAYLALTHLMKIWFHRRFGLD